jgi:spermidine dehydrogenase
LKVMASSRKEAFSFLPAGSSRVGVREDLARAFGPHGFDPAQDIVGVTLDRWWHAMVVPYPGFAFGRFAGAPGPPQIARQRFGRIAFAHTDVEGTPYMEATYLESHRAVQELLE